MRENTPTVAAVEAQLRRVRRRWNARELQRVVGLLVALAAGAGIVVALLALLAPPAAFAVVGGAAALAGGLAAAGVLRDGIHRRLSAGRAAVAVDRRARLRGTLATLLEPAPAGRDDFFLPLLRAQNAARLPAWRPTALVPRLVPWGTVAVATASVATLLLLLALAPALAPAPGARDAATATGGFSRHGEGVSRDGRLADTADTDQPAADAGPAAAPGDGAEDGAVALAAAVQARIRDRLWGEDRRAPSAGASPAAPRAGRPDDRPRRDGEGEPADGAEHDWERARLASGGGRPAPGRDPPRDAPRRGDEGGPEGARAGGARDDDHDPRPAGRGDAAAGAGSGSDTELFGAPSADDTAESDTFALSLAARLRGGGPAARPPTGAPPPAAADARPALAARQPDEAPVRRTPIPPGWEAIVRSVFARHPQSQEGTP
jgi:hypothetical protein